MSAITSVTVSVCALVCALAGSASAQPALGKLKTRGTGGVVASPQTYWVSPTGAAAWAACFSGSPLSGASACSVTTANANATAGDVVQFVTGEYTTALAPANSGSAGLPITFRAAPGPTVTLARTVTLTNKDYITIGGSLSSQGFRIEPTSSFGIVSASGSNNLVIQNNYISAQATGGVCIRLGATTPLTDIVVKNNTITHCGWGLSGTGTNAIQAFGDRMLFDGNDISYSLDMFFVGGTHIVIRNHMLGPVDVQAMGCVVEASCHHDMIQVSGNTLTESLIENNIAKDCVDTTGNCHFFLVRNGAAADADTIIGRYNYGQNLDYGAFQYGGSNDEVPNGRAYNNTFAWETTGNSDIGGCIGFTNATNGKALNNICYNVRGSNLSPTYFSPAGFGSHNVAFKTGYSGEWLAPYLDETTYATFKNVDPVFTNYPTSAALSALSPLIDAGGALTTVHANDTSAGTSLIVTDAYFFQALSNVSGVEPDWICVTTVSNCVQIASINYATSTLTLVSAISRSDADNVWLYKDSDGTRVLYGSGPDIGATERVQ